MTYGNRNIDGPKVKKMFIIQEIEIYTSKRTIFQMHKLWSIGKAWEIDKDFLLVDTFPKDSFLQGLKGQFFISLPLWWTDFKMALIIPPPGTQALVKSSPFECGQDLWLLINYSRSHTMGRCGSPRSQLPLTLVLRWARRECSHNGCLQAKKESGHPVTPGAQRSHKCEARRLVMGLCG